MKKTISLTLVLIMLLSSLCSCNGKKPDESDKNIDNNDNNYNQNIEDDNGGENDNSENDDDENDNDNNNDINDQKTDPSKLTYEDKSIAVAKDEQGDYYAYIKEWDAYYLMPDEFVYTHIIYHPYCYPIVHDNVAWLLTLENPNRERKDQEGYTLRVYKFTNGSEIVETYTHICEPKEHYGEMYTVFYGFYDEDHGYIFFWDENDAWYGNNSTTSYLRTDDGGKTWYSTACEKPASASKWQEEPIVAKFVSDDVGVVCYRNHFHDDFRGSIFITADGGKTWEGISADLPYPESLLEYSYSNVVGFEYINNEYFVYAEIYGKGGIVIDVQFSSTDLKSWKLVQQSNITEIVEAYKEYIKNGGMYVKDMVSCSAFALVDYNRDGILDIAMQSGDLYWDNYAWHVLCYEDGKLKMRSVPGHSISAKDGSISWNERAGTIYGRRKCDSSQDKFIKIWEIENDGTENAKYYINDLSVSSDEILSYFKECSCREEYEIYKFTEENIEKYINVETFSDKSYFCSCPEPKTDYDGYCDIINLYKNLILSKNEGNDVSTFDASGYSNIHSDISDALKRIVFNNIHQLMGYAFKDINDDGITELVLLDRDYNIFAIFTSVNKKAVLLDTFGVANNTGAIDKDGRIYKSGYSKGETDYEKVMILTESGELKEEIKYGCSDMEDGQAPRYYKYVSGEKHDITKAEYDELGTQYSSIFSDTAKVTEESGIAFNEIMEFDPK